MKGGNVSMTRDPENNVVEIMGVPRSASGETLTWGMAVSDEAAAKKFYGETLGLAEFDPWNLPPPFSMRMYLFAAGAGRVKFSAPPGQRPRKADAGPDAPGLRNVTLRVADLAAAREGLTKRGAKFEGEMRLLVTDPDGNRFYIEQAPPEAIEAAASGPATPASPNVSGRNVAVPGQRRQNALERIRAQYGDIKPKPHKEEIAEQRLGEPPLKKMPDGDPARDAAGRGQLFESICVPGITELQEGMNGVAIVDLNNDGLLDLVFAADPDNSGVVLSMAGYASKVYWNTGLHGAKENHWLRVRFSGVTHAELTGARVEVTAAGRKQYRWIHPNHSYKSGGALEAHFGLGKQTAADLKVTLPHGKTASFADVKADQFLDLNLTSSQSTPVRAETKP